MIVVTVEMNPETLLLAVGAFLSGGGSLLSGFASVVTAFRQGIETAATAAAVMKGAE